MSRATDDSATWPHQAIILVAPRHAGAIEFVTPGIAALPGFAELVKDFPGQYQVIPMEPVRDKDTLMAGVDILFTLYVENCRQAGVPLPEHDDEG